MIRDIPLPDGGNWGLIPYRPNVQPSTLWGDRAVGVRQFQDMFRFDFEPGEDTVFKIFDEEPGASWLEAYETLSLASENVLLTAESFSESAIARINSIR